MSSAFGLPLLLLLGEWGHHHFNFEAVFRGCCHCVHFVVVEFFAIPGQSPKYWLFSERRVTFLSSMFDERLDLFWRGLSRWNEPVWCCFPSSKALFQSTLRLSSSILFVRFFVGVSGLFISRPLSQSFNTSLDTHGCKSSPYCCFKMRCNVWILQFLYVKSYPRVLVFPILLQPQIYCHRYKIVITSYISAGKCSCFRLFDARLESLRCQDVVDLAVCFPVRRMLRYSHGSLVWVQCVCYGKVFTACKF